MRRGIRVFLLALSALVVSAPAQDKAAKIDELMSLYHDYRQFNGSVLVAEHGKVIYKKGFGLANMEWNIPNTPATKFRLGSITKQFTAAVVLQLIEEGKLRLDGRICDYLPEYPKKSGERVTIHQLLTHTSGIPSYTGLPDFFEKMSAILIRQWISSRYFPDSILNSSPDRNSATTIRAIFFWELSLKRSAATATKRCSRKGSSSL
jgi:CubicO group peptidase (beta-lactamase class C family)